MLYFPSHQVIELIELSYQYIYVQELVIYIANASLIFLIEFLAGPPTETCSYGIVQTTILIRVVLSLENRRSSIRTLHRRIT